MGRETKPTVVLVHGQPGEGADWRLVVERLGRGMEVLSPDRPGWGSNRLAATGMSGNADWLSGVLGVAAPGEAVTVVGHSFGGGVAISLARRHPSQVGALVLVGSVGVARALTASDHLLALPLVGDRLVRLGLVSARRLLRGLQAGIQVTERFADRAVTELDGALHGALTAGRDLSGGRIDIASRASHLSFVRALVEAEAMPARSWESFVVEQRGLVEETPWLGSALEGLRVPVAVVTGDRDRIVPLAAARELADRISGAELVTVPRSGHLVPVEAPEILAGVIRRYAAAPHPPRRPEVRRRSGDREA